MLHAIVRARVLLAMVVAACVDLWGLHLYPMQTANPFLGLIQLERPLVFQVLAYGYVTLCFTTPFLAASLVTSLLAIIIYRYPQTTRARGLPPYTPPESRSAPTLVLGETHFLRASGERRRPRG